MKDSMNTSSQLCRQEFFFTCLFIGLGTVNMVHHSSCLLAFKSSFNRTYLSTVDTKNTREYRRGNQKRDNPEKKKRIVQYPFYCCEFKGNI